MRNCPRTRRLLGGGAIAGWLVLATSLQASPWAQVRTVAPGPPSAIGEAANGCLAGAQALPAEGKGYVQIRRERQRQFGHPQTLDFVRELGAAQASRTARYVMIGDLSQPRGGLMSSSHRSHQNGLDLDVWFLLADSPAQAQRDWPEAIAPPSMVRDDGLTVNRLWGPDQRLLLKLAAEDGRVERIFVNPAIKQRLCDSEGGDRGWLRKLRPWRGHDAHFHVRLKCPAGSPHCQAQAPFPAGDGCGAELAWWFTAEARQPRKSAEDKPPAPMPAACRALLGQPDLARKD
ncbi:MAG: penicillin-insensitive murein endopeptidase [Gammaproteobacteria bacterium]|jgi:penicillin-insensitive murein endopeptidase|nr:penicillin-insensitive murein endopeptidase [Gammaproteobacteria bacterium]